MISVRLIKKTCIMLLVLMLLPVMTAFATDLDVDMSEFFPPLTKQERLEKTVYLQNLNYAAACDGVLTVINPQDKKVMPKHVDGKFYIPLRFVLEYYGVGVSWDHETKSVVMTAGDKEYKLCISDGVFSHEDKTKTLDNRLFIERGTTFVAFEDIQKIIRCDTHYYEQYKSGVIVSGPSWQSEEQAEKQAVKAMEFAISPFFKMFV